MATQIWDRKVVTTSGLTGTANVDLTPFDFSTYGITTITRLTIDVDILALPTAANLANGYGEYLCGRFMVDYKVTGGVSAAIVAQTIPLLNGVNIVWTPGFTSGNFHVNAAAQASSLTWSIVMSAVMRDWLERP